MENSRHMSLPPGFKARCISLKPSSGWVRLRMPKPTMAASKPAAAQERRSASPWMIDDAGGHPGARPPWAARLHHGPVDVVDQHPAAGADLPGGQEGQVGGAAADVEDPVPRL